MKPIVSINSSTGIPLSTVTFLNACSDMTCFGGAVCAAAAAIFSIHTTIVAMAPATGGADPSFIVVSRCGKNRSGRLLLLVAAHSAQWPPFPELTLDGIDTVFFAHVPVGRSIGSLAPETLLDLLRAVHQLQCQLLPAPRAHVGLRIRQRQAELQIVVVNAPETLLQTHLIAVNRAVGVDPGPVIEAGGVDHEGVAVPMSGRIAVLARLRISRDLAPVRPQVAPRVVPFEELDEFVVELHEPVVAVVQVAGITGRIALEQRIVPILLVLKEPKGQGRIPGGRLRLAPFLLAPIRHGGPLGAQCNIEATGISPDA